MLAVSYWENKERWSYKWGKKVSHQDLSVEDKIFLCMRKSLHGCQWIQETTHLSTALAKSLIVWRNTVHVSCIINLVHRLVHANSVETLMTKTISEMKEIERRFNPDRTRTTGANFTTTMPTSIMKSTNISNVMIHGSIAKRWMRQCNSSQWIWKCLRAIDYLDGATSRGK